MGAVIRLAREEDAWGMLEIYTPIVRETAISFELDPPSVEELQHRVATYLDFAPWLVCCRQESILGYAYASQHRVREAYQWSVDVSVYVNERFRNQGVATALYKSLFGCLALQGFYNAYAGITQPNAVSVTLHEGLGFQPVAKYLIIGLGDFVRAEIELQFFNGNQRFFFTHQKMLIFITGRVHRFNQLFEFQFPKKRNSYYQQDRNNQNQF